MKRHSVAEIITKAGGSKRLAAACGVSVQAFTYWKRKNAVPLAQIWVVSEMTGLSPYEIRPDYFPRNKKAPTA